MILPEVFIKPMFVYINSQYDAVRNIFIFNLSRFSIRSSCSLGQSILSITQSCEVIDP
jgi:hypothetical protein